MSLLYDTNTPALPPLPRIRDARGRFLPTAPGARPTWCGTVSAQQHTIAAALARFAARCRFDPATGCVIWAGGTTAGAGHGPRYGAFWYDGRRWFAHRWAAAFIDGHAIDGAHVDHHCPHGPDTLCVQHVTPISAAANRALQGRRRATLERDGVPFYSSDAWLESFR